MHIAYVCGDRGVPIGGTKGASVHVRSLSQALAARHRVSLLAANPGGGPLDGFTPEVHDVGYDATLKRLKRRLAAGRPAGTESREIYALLLGHRIYRRLDEIHRARAIDAVYERHSLWSWAALAFAREAGVPHVLEVNAPLVREQATYRKLAMSGVARACESELVSGADVVVVPSEALARHARRLGARRAAVHVLPNAVDAALFSAPPALPARERGPLEGRFVVAFAGSLKAWHGIEVLLDAFRRLLSSTPRAHLLVLGDGPLRAKVEEAASELGGERVTAPGAVPHEAVPRWLAHAHAGVAPYLRQEEFYFSPLKVVEYQAAGLPVVASDQGHIRRQVADLVTGILVPPGDPIRLAEALERLARQPALARRIGRQARARVLAGSTWERVAARVESLVLARVAAPRLRLAVGRSGA
ncbi:MAG: glycosyltransferase family 4 protein [Acidobacteriota bacterium]|nr:glycosyltransferase family 4 protein [Acidobacteriota bacterium]